MKHILFLFLFIFIFSTQLIFSQAVFRSITNGNWNDAGTWLKTGSDEDDIPDANDTVRIATVFSDDVTIPSGFTGGCATLEIGSPATSTSGSLISSRNLLKTMRLIMAMTNLTYWVKKVNFWRGDQILS